MRPFLNTVRVVCAAALCLALGVAGVAAQDQLREAAALEAAGDFDAAVEKYEAFITEHPDDHLAPLAAVTVANIHYLAKEDLDAAVAAYDRVLESYGESAWAAEAARRKGECLQAQEQWLEAGDAFGRALELAGLGEDPPTTEWINEVSLAAANCYYELGDRSRVIGAFEKALQQSMPPHSTAAVLYRLADSYESNGEAEKAAEHYAKVIEEYPFSRSFDQAYGKRELVEQHVDLDWRPYEAYAQTTTDFRNRDYQAVVDRAKEIVGDTDNSVLRQCATYRKIVAETTITGDFTRGTQQLDSLLGSLTDRRAMPNAEQQLAQFERVAELEAQACDSPEDPTVLRRLGEMYLRSRSMSRAAEALEKALAAEPEDEQTHLLLGFAYAGSQRADEATEAFDYYFDRNPGEAGTLNQVGYTYLQLGDAETAITYFKRYVEAAPDDANAHDSLGEGYLTAGRLEDAAREYERAVEMDPAFSNSHFMLGNVYRQMEDHEKAAAAYQRFLELSPSGAQADQARQALHEMEEQMGGEN
jgi:tetratricopeptide (TPR) repeat protein